MNTTYHNNLTNTQIIREILQQIQLPYHHTNDRHGNNIIITTNQHTHIRIYLHLTNHHLHIRPCNHHTSYQQQIELADPQLINKTQQALQNTKQIQHTLTQATIINNILQNINITNHTPTQNHNHQLTKTIHTPENNIQLTINQKTNQLTITINEHTTTTQLENINHQNINQKINQILNQDNT